MSAPSGLLFGKLPGNRKWSLYYVETTAAAVHIREGSANPARRKGRQLRTLIISPNDLVGEEKSRKKKRFKFFLQRLDGRYLFRCKRAAELANTLREDDHSVEVDNEGRPAGSFGWSRLKREDLEGLADAQGQEDSDDYSEADLGPLDGSSTQELEEYPWFWGWMSREDCERRLHAEGEVGNFVVRINAMGDYVMSFWRTDLILHHKITHDGNIYRFERSTVPAEGASLAGLLHVYTNQYSDKIVPFGGSLFMRHAQDDHLKHQQLVSRASDLVPTPPTRRNQYPPVALKQDPFSGRNTDHQDGFEAQQPAVPQTQLNDRPLPTPPTRKNQHLPVDPLLGRNTDHHNEFKTLKTQLPPVPPTRLTDRPLPTPPLARKQFSYEHTSVQRSASLDVMHTHDNPVHVNLMHTRPLPPRQHHDEPDWHHYINQRAMDQTWHDEPQLKQKRDQLEQRKERRNEQQQQEQPRQQEWQLNQGRKQFDQLQQQWREAQQQEQQEVNLGKNVAEDHYQNQAMIRLHAKISPR